MFNPTTTVYKVLVLRGDGKKYDVSNLVIKLGWREADGDLVQRASVTLVNMYTSANLWTEHLVCPGAIIFIFADGREVFRGPVWEHTYSSKINAETIDITACDRMIYLNQSKESAYYGEGQTTGTILSQVCIRWGIPMDYLYTDYIHSKLVIKNKTIEDEINEVLTEAQSKNGAGKFVCYFSEDILRIRERGYNKEVYILSGGEGGCHNVFDVEVRNSLSNFVSRVNILGKADTDGREPIENTIDGDLNYGVLQEQIYRDTDATSEAAIAEARTILSERNKLARETTVIAPDIPFVRKGHKIKCVFSGEVNGYFYVLFVNHNATARTMDLKLERA